jgi:hypothetical protein
MAITIIIEDGSIVSGANSYASVAQARAFATNRGVELSSDNDVVASMLIQATDYLETFACQYQGEKVDGLEQSLEWPRSGVVIHGKELAETSIPELLVKAQLQAVLAVKAGIALLPNYSARDFVIKEKVGELETQYANPLSVGMQPKLSSVESLLAPLFGSCDFIGFRTERV